MEDKDLIAAKLESLMRCVRRIESKRPANVAVLEQDLDAQDILAVNIERAVQLCVDICLHWLSARGLAVPASMAETFSVVANVDLLPADLAARLSKAVGFRNIAVHQYEKINWSIVHSIAWERLDDFRKFSGYIAAAIQGEHA